MTLRLNVGVTRETMELGERPCKVAIQDIVKVGIRWKSAGEDLSAK